MFVDFRNLHVVCLCLWCLCKGFEGGISGLPRWLRWQRICLQCRRPGFNPWFGKIPWRRVWQLTSVCLSREFQTEAPEFMGSQRVGHDWSTFTGEQRKKTWIQVGAAHLSTAWRCSDGLHARDSPSQSLLSGSVLLAQTFSTQPGSYHSSSTFTSCMPKASSSARGERLGPPWVFSEHTHSPGNMHRSN